MYMYGCVIDEEHDGAYEYNADVEWIADINKVMICTFCLLVVLRRLYLLVGCFVCRNITREIVGEFL